MEVYSVRDLTFTYPQADAPALKNITFTLCSGEFITLCGLSGSGKSTLLRQLKTCLAPNGSRSGEIIFEGQSLEETPPAVQAAKIGFVMQSPDDQSVTDKVWHELAFGLESLGLDNSVIQSRTAEMAAFFGIEDLYERSVDELSGGQKQLVNLASVMVMQPSVLILDEPTARLDPIASGEFLAMLKKINRELSVSIILCEHSLEEAYSVSDRIVVMSEGSIISDTTPASTGRKLYSMKEPMFLSIPAPSRIFELAVGDKKADDSRSTPLSVSDGRVWLEEYKKDRTLVPVPESSGIKHEDKTLLSIKELWFRYDKQSPDILKGLQLDIYRGEFLTVLGGNGTGKTTMLSVIADIVKPYRGRLRYDNSNAKGRPKTALLMQDPRTVFVRQTVKDDLYEIFSGTKIPVETQHKKVERVVKLCGLEHLLQRYPYDLSGGEQQKAALAKVLLTEPELLLLDEPEKGLDTAYKRRLAGIIKKLTSEGVAVVSVSHDTEFCGEYSDRCVMMFGGRIVSMGTPKQFFSQNSIYTTSVSRMTRGLIDNAVTVDDALYAMSVKNDTDSFEDDNGNSLADESVRFEKDITPPKKQKRRFGILRKMISGLFLAVFVFSLFLTADIVRLPVLSDNTTICYGMMVVSAVLFMLFFGSGEKKLEIAKSKKSKGRTAIAFITVLIAVPLTVIAGVYFLDDSKYLFISLLVMFESIFPFYIMFEKRQIQARELVLMAVLCAMCTVSRAAFYMLPEFKPLTALVIIFSCALGGESGFMIGSVSMLASNIFFGQGIWTPWQMFTMGLIGFLSGELFQSRLIRPGRISLAIFGFLSAYIIYGGIMNPATLILSRSPITMESLIAVYTVGLPVDTIHAFSTAVFLYIGVEPVIMKLERIKQKYGLIR